MNISQSRHQQAGVMMLEVLIAILIFAFGILGIVGLQATSIKQVTDAKFRMEATLLTNQLIASMWMTDRTTATMQSNFDSANSTHPGYDAWKAVAVGALPGSTDFPPQVSVSNDGIVTVTLWWIAPNDRPGSAPHRHVTIAQIR